MNYSDIQVGYSVLIPWKAQWLEQWRRLRACVARMVGTAYITSTIISSKYRAVCITDLVLDGQFGGCSRDRRRRQSHAV